jgi:hypothetical protein
MRRDSVLEKYELFFTAAVLAGHFNFREEGFRQKDIRFLIELFSNWMEATLGDVSLEIHNVQISRFLEGVVQEGRAKRLRGKTPRYQLTRHGLVQLLSGLVSQPSFLPLEHVFFIYYFLKSYGKLFDDLLANEGYHFSPSLRAELVALRSPELLVQNQRRFVDKEIAKLDSRIQEARDAARLGETILARNGRTEEIVSEIQRRFPYELNSRKPLSELISEVPEPFRAWEMTRGLHNRADYLWVPLRAHLHHYRTVLESLA